MSASTLAAGEIDANKLYSVEGLAHVLNRTPRWVRDAFVRPVNPDTRERLIDPRTGRPVPPVPHWKQGSLVLMWGQSIINWIVEYGWLTMEETE